jgi:protein TonB
MALQNTLAFAVSTIGHVAVLGGVIWVNAPAHAHARTETFLEIVEVAEAPAPEVKAEDEPLPISRALRDDAPRPIQPAKPVEAPAPAPTVSDNPYDDLPEPPAVVTAESSGAFAMPVSATAVTTPAVAAPVKAITTSGPPVNADALRTEFASWRRRVGQAVAGLAAQRYPTQARRLGHEGTVVLQMSIDPIGAIASVNVARSSGHDELDQAALAAVRSLQRVPSPPAAVRDLLRAFSVPITYRLD